MRVHPLYDAFRLREMDEISQNASIRSVAVARRPVQYDSAHPERHTKGRISLKNPGGERLAGIVNVSPNSMTKER
jgi:hypothetical protein